MILTESFATHQLRLIVVKFCIKWSKWLKINSISVLKIGELIKEENFKAMILIWGQKSSSNSFYIFFLLEMLVSFDM